MEVKETTTEVKETKSCSGYEKPPWVFKGSALYQLHLVKSETARAFIPKEFRLVEAFGYTLGGFFLASYDDSPAGSFEEDVGLPSQVAKFSKRITEIPRQSNSKINGLLNMIGLGSTVSSPKNCKNVQVSEIKGPVATDICAINLGIAVPEQNPNKFLGPVIKMSLPSFSGRTEYNSNLLKYSCQIECRMRPVHPAKVLGPSLIPKNDAEQSSEWQNSDFMDPTTREVGEKERNLSISVMLSKPILALEFNCLKMQIVFYVGLPKNRPFTQLCLLQLYMTWGLDR
ncbi:protein NEOXANTHIN-DEFICIENT 1 isoform X3 [Cornus florida]|uniref:protein NEOXANTHIN-DEFICIENT 1 isoform X3 n=1 Tax=Cornus florida TaxID=4283 RepID=UPI00289DB41B|nr:protein NEOXANTHIN-DEFICIENT 1 isoform X3 [Cornus florida]